MLGSEALMRLSLVISRPPAARGTLKSTRMKTRFPLRSRSRIERVLIGLPLLRITSRAPAAGLDGPSKVCLARAVQLAASPLVATFLATADCRARPKMSRRLSTQQAGQPAGQPAPGL